MIAVQLALLIAACVLFILAALNINAPKVTLGWAGLACWVLAEVLSRVH